MQETNKITTALGVKLNKSAILYHTIQVFVNMIQGQAEPNNAFKLRFRNVCDTMELANSYNIISIKQLTKNKIQAS